MARVCALIPAAGRGVRFGGGENKVFTPLLGRPLLGWTLEAFAQCAVIDSVVLIGTDDELDRLKEIGNVYGGGKLAAVVPGGATRQESVRLGLDTLPDSCSHVIVHDAARCCITPTLIMAVAQGAFTYGVASAMVPVADSLMKLHTDNHFADGRSDTWQAVDRSGIYAVQTPQAFTRELLHRAHEAALHDHFVGTDDLSLVRRISNDAYWEPVSGSPENLKVTTPEDGIIAEAILEGRMRQTIRVGHGYDVHRLVAGREMWLGGVHFPESEFGLEGHSDADAPLHALCDALLGAAGLPDIGQLFPPSDMAHKNRASIEFVQEVKARLSGFGWSVENVDLSILAEAPKIGPRAGEMKMVIAGALGIEPEQVSIKATTNEGLGFIGRGEGIAAHVSALISRRGKQ
jgi:2-C-methyl-D-erythritol 4-phosphate cytidylyltransferase / 2-C-methyl-D-erythritol 2,4-cyclodiphosphate synthase